MVLANVAQSPCRINSIPGIGGGAGERAGALPVKNAAATAINILHRFTMCGLGVELIRFQITRVEIIESKAVFAAALF